MKIGIPKEIKDNENRVAITPQGVETLVGEGHEVYIEKNAGQGSGISDENYKSVGASIVESAKDIFKIADMIVKVKEPLESEFELFRENQILFTYLHLAAAKKLTFELMKKNIVSIAYETVEKDDKSLPLLTPMSEVAGRLSTQEGAIYLKKHKGGEGILLGGVPGVLPAKVVIIGGGVVGLNAAKMAVGLGADVTILDLSAKQMAYIDDIFNGRVKTLMSNKYNIQNEIKNADLVIGAVLIPGKKAPSLVTEDMIKEMKPGSVIVDVAIDQGGCFETTYPTSHSNPVFVKHGVVHYSVANMPGAVPKTSTYALTNVTLPYINKIANKGYKEALLNDPALLKGLNVYKGKITYKGVAEAFDLDFHDPFELLSN